MVDPNRKINHLTEEDVKYLNECENEFKDRFTENDDEFAALSNQPVSDPPIVTPWMTRSGNAGSSNYRGHRNYNQRPYHHRHNRSGGGGSGNYNRNYGHNDGDRREDRRGTKRPYNYNSGNDHSAKYNKRDYN